MRRDGKHSNNVSQPAIQSTNERALRELAAAYLSAKNPSTADRSGSIFVNRRKPVASGAPPILRNADWPNASSVTSHSSMVARVLVLSSDKRAFDAGRSRSRCFCISLLVTAAAERMLTLDAPGVPLRTMNSMFFADKIGKGAYKELIVGSGGFSANFLGG